MIFQSFNPRDTKMKTKLIIILLLLSIALKAQEADSATIAKYFNNHTGAIVVLNNSTGKYFRYNEQRCAERFLPASTFKIPNSLIGLETGVISDENFVIKWDGIERSKEWDRDHTLATALKYSVVPYYQELARRVGKEKYMELLLKIDYGNNTVGEVVDRFWLDNSLRISADEQIEFLKRFYDYKLPFSKRSVDIVKKIMSEEKYPNSVMKFKTGTGNKEDKNWIGWLVGYVEKQSDVYFFAFNVERKEYADVSKLRNEAARAILKLLKVIE
jgi:beta-lactamase class D